MIISKIGESNNVFSLRTPYIINLLYLCKNISVFLEINIMNLNERSIEDYFSQLDINEIKSSFPYEIDYIARYKEISGTLYRDVHPLVEKGANILDGVCLNNHGERHIKTVIKRASQLVQTTGFEMTPYELYILLMGIHLHDVGNIRGRAHHEEKISSVILDIEKYISSITFVDDVEKELIIDIAKAHGGSYDNLLSLNHEDRILDQKVHTKYIAAIIRLADELSDDSGRAHTLLLHNGTIPEDAQIYHIYSHCLKTAEYQPDNKSISYIFRVEEKYLHKKFVMNGKEVFFIDEIYARTVKTFKEAVMCTKLLRPNIYVDKVRVAISIVLEDKDVYGNPKKIQLQYDIEDIGYPEIDFGKMCPQMAHLTGEYISDKLKNKQFEYVRC